MRARTVLAAVALHAAAVVWLTWPLAAHVSTHFADTVPICRFDARLIAFVLAHQSRALLSDPTTLADAGIYHPAAHTLFYGEAAFGALPYFMPTFLASGNPALALNLTFLGSLVLTATALHLVVWRWSGSHAGGAVAGLVFLASRWVHWTWVPAAPNYAVLQYFPVIILLAADAAPSARRQAALLGLIVLQGLSTVYAAAAVMAPLGFLALARAVRRTTRRAGLGLLLVLGLAALVLLGMYSGYLIVRRDNPALASQTMWTLRAFFGTMVLPWHLLDPKAPTSVPPAALLLIVIGGASIVLGGWRQLDAPARRGWRHGLFWTLAGLFVSLTPSVRLGSGAAPPIELPQALLDRWIPVFAVVREVHRLGMAALMGIALLGGLALAECTRRLGRHVPENVARGVGAALALGLAVVMYHQAWQGEQFRPTGPRPSSYPIHPAPTPEASRLSTVLAQPGGPLLETEIPTSRRLVLDAARNSEAMYNAIFHRRRILNGYSGYWPAGFGQRLALIEALPHPTALRTLQASTGVALILVHDRTASPELREFCDVFARFKLVPPECEPAAVGAQRAAWLAAAAGRRADLRLVARDGNDLLLAVEVP